MNTPKQTTCVVLCLLGLYTAMGQSGKPLPPDSLLLHDTLTASETKEQLADNLPVISLNEEDLKNAGTAQPGPLLHAGRDPFYGSAAYQFSAAHFRLRGYGADQFGVLLNGLPVENADNGAASWGWWAGLNELLRNRIVTTGLQANAAAFGKLGTTTAIDTRASHQRKQTSIGYALSNRSYVHRFSFAHAGGVNAKGWAFATGGSLRWAGEGYIPGTYYRGYSYFFSADKKLGARHLLSFTALGAPTESGRQGASVEEMQQLAGTRYYNPYWGYQAGKKRNASIAKTNQPFLLFSHEYALQPHVILTTSIGYMNGNRSTTGLDWYNAPDPRPDYYRYLPSYAADALQQEQLARLMQQDESLRQVNWQQLYQINHASRETVYNANGIAGNPISGLRSHYIVEERIVHTQRLQLNSVVQAVVNDRVTVSGGLAYEQQKNRYYKKVNDLLGGDFYVDLNQFAEQDFPNNAAAGQNDLRRPNRILNTGDRFGYDYAVNFRKTSGWLQVMVQCAKMDFFVATLAANTFFQRNGQVQNGLFPAHSLGKSPANTFNNYAFKAGITYRINGRHFVYLNAAVLTQPPFYDNVYISPRTRDSRQAQVVSESLCSVEAGYVLHAPRLRIRLSGYYTQTAHGMNVLSFYHDDYRNFVNYALRDIGKLYAGAEAGVEAKVLPNVTVNAVVACGRYYYHTRQHATVIIDNSTAVTSEETVYVQNFRIPGTPQQVVGAGVTYRSPDDWMLSITGSYIDQWWLDFNPIRRTFGATQGLDYKGAQWHRVVDQVQLPPQYLLDFFGGYSWRLPHHRRSKKQVYLLLNAGISNLMNNRNVVSGGYEQLRFDFAQKNIDRFPPKLYYAYGLSYFLSATVRL